MARIEWVHTRLLNWQRWMLSSGSGALGYSAIRLAPDQCAPEPWAEAPIPTNDIEASETHDGIQALPGELRAAVNVKYIGKIDPRSKVERFAPTESQQLAKLCISRATLYARLDRAQVVLAQWLQARREKRDGERSRVERLQVGQRAQG